MILRRNFLSLVLLAPLAKLVAPFRSEPTYQRVGKYKRYIGTMRITPEAMDKMYYMGGRGGGKTEFQRLLTQTLEQHRREMDRIYGHHTAARGIEITASGR